MNPDHRFFEIVREAKARELVYELRLEFPDLVIYCEHVRKMLKDIGCPPEDWHIYDPQCSECERKI